MTAHKGTNSGKKGVILTADFYQLPRTDPTRAYVIPLTIRVLTPHILHFLLQAQPKATDIQVSLHSPDKQAVAASTLKRSGGYGMFERIKMPKFDAAESPSTPLKGGMADASAAMSPAAFSRIKDALESEGVAMNVYVFYPPPSGVNGAPALFKVVAFDFMNNKAFKTYWTHKPDILAEVLALDAEMALAADGNKLPGFLHDLRVALVRRLPCGPNEVSSYESGKAKVKIEKMVFFTYVPLTMTNDDLKVLSGNFLELVKSDAVKRSTPTICLLAVGSTLKLSFPIPTLPLVNTGRSLLVQPKTQRSLKRRALTVCSWTARW